VPRITNPNTWVAAVGDDNYTAAVTPAEQLVGGRPLQLSLNEDGAALAQPRHADVTQTRSIPPRGPADKNALATI